ELHQPNGSFLGSGSVTSRTSTQLVTSQMMTGAEPGTYTVNAKNPDGQTSKALPLALYDEVNISPSAGSAGTMFNYTGRGFTANFGVTSHLKRPNGTEFSTLQIPTSASGT